MTFHDRMNPVTPQGFQPLRETVLGNRIFSCVTMTTPAFAVGSCFTSIARVSVVYTIHRIHGRLKISVELILGSCVQNRYFTLSLRSLVRYRFLI